RQKQQDNAVGAIINFNCILRTLDLKQQGRTQEYADLFTDTPTVGFSTYGESYIGHINQTATMLLLNKA
ncbi:MAG: FIST C-terminal domain-containing protein, partial [Bacteroidota bacterium]